MQILLKIDNRFCCCGECCSDLSVGIYWLIALWHNSMLSDEQFWCLPPEYSCIVFILQMTNNTMNTLWTQHEQVDCICLPHQPIVPKKHGGGVFFEFLDANYCKFLYFQTIHSASVNHSELETPSAWRTALSSVTWTQTQHASLSPFRLRHLRYWKTHTQG